MTMRDQKLYRRIARVVRAAEWRRTGDQGVADFIGCSRYFVTQVRRELGLQATEIDANNRWGKRVLTTRGRPAGSRRGEKLTLAQSQRIELVADLAIKLARKKANKVLSFEELQSIAYDALIVATRAWKPGKSYKNPRKATKARSMRNWRGFAYYGIINAFNRHFARARTQLKRERLLSSPQADSFDDDDGRVSNEHASGADLEDRVEEQTLVERLRDIHGLHRLVLEWISGIDPSQKVWKPADIVKFMNDPRLDEERVKKLIDEGKEMLIG